MQSDRPGRAAPPPRLHSLFFRHLKGLATVLVTKDRVLGHNPVAALHLADSCYSRVWGPEKPAELRKLPVAGRREKE